MHAEGLTSVQPLDQTIFTHNLESELYSSTNKSPHSTLKVTLKAQKVNRFYSIYSEQKNNGRNSSTKKENISVSLLSLIVSPFVQILIYFLIIWREISLFFSHQTNQICYIFYFIFAPKKYFSKAAFNVVFVVLLLKCNNKRTPYFYTKQHDI